MKPANCWPKDSTPAQPRGRKLATRVAAANTFEAVAREFHATQASGWSPRYAARWIERMEKDLFPYIGKLTLPAITAPVLLDALRKVESAALTKPPTPCARPPGRCSATGCRLGVANAAP
jgi:integrase